MNNNISQINGKSDNKSANKGVLQKLTKTSKYLPLFFLAPKFWFLRTRINVRVYSGTFRLQEY